MARFGHKNMFFGQTILTVFTAMIDFPMPLITTVSKMLVGHPSAIHLISVNNLRCLLQSKLEKNLKLHGKQNLIKVASKPGMTIAKLHEKHGIPKSTQSLIHRQKAISGYISSLAILAKSWMTNLANIARGDCTLWWQADIMVII